MGYIINDIEWWKLSILGFVNGWLPGILTFLLGMALSKIASRREMKHSLKKVLLGIFIPTFNTGSKISVYQVNQAIIEFRVTLTTYRQIYPNTFNAQAADRLGHIFRQGLYDGDGEIASEFKKPQVIIDLIKTL